MGNVTPLFILNEKYDIFLSIYERFTVEDWRENTKDWPDSKRRNIGLTSIVIEASKIKPHAERVRIAKKLLARSAPPPPQDDVIVDLSTQKLTRQIRTSANPLVEICALIYALSDEAILRILKALSQNGKIPDSVLSRAETN